MGIPATDPVTGPVEALFGSGDLSKRPGIAVGIYRDGRPVALQGFGQAELEHPRPITPQTIFHVASVSKQFTAFAIALLAREGRLDLDADIRRYLPFVPDFGHVMTSRHLLHHTSGLRDQWSLFSLAGQDMGNRLRQEHILNLVAHQRALNFVPGTDHLYSNTGYTLLAEIVRVVSDQSLRQFTSERIFAPLGMTRTFFHDDVTELVPERARSYTQDAHGTWHRALLNFDNVGATSLFTTVEDLLKWARNFSHPAVGDSQLIEQIGEPGALRDGTPINYGFGLMRSHYAGQEALVHFGSDAAFRAVFAYFPARDFAVVLLANHVVEDLESLLSALVDTCLNERPRTAKEYMPPVITPDRERLRELEGHYLNEVDPLVALEEANGRLLWKAAGSAPKSVVFRTDGTFDLGNGARNWNFYRAQRDTAGRVVGFQDVARKVPSIARPRQRIEPAQPSPSELEQLAGEYRCPELDITYVFSVKDGALMARSVWSVEPIVFTPSLPDRFDAEPYWMSAIEIVRDAQRLPKGFRAHGGRVRHVWFEKISRSMSHPKSVRPF